MPFTATWMQLVIITLIEVSQKKINTIWYHLYVESKMNRWTYLQNGNKFTDIENRLVVAKGKEVMKGRTGSVGLADVNCYI